MTAEIIMALLLLDDATRAPELFAKSARVFTAQAEATVAANTAYIASFDPADLDAHRAE